MGGDSPNFLGSSHNQYLLTFQERLSACMNHLFIIHPSKLGKRVNDQILQCHDRKNAI